MEKQYSSTAFESGLSGIPGIIGVVGGSGGHKNLKARQFLLIELCVHSCFGIEDKRLGSTGNSKMIGDKNFVYPGCGPEAS